VNQKDMASRVSMNGNNQNENELRVESPKFIKKI